MKRITSDDIESLKENEVFVFGSNEAGIHGAGAARDAMQWGAMLSIGFGPQGHTFAIPTKDWKIKRLGLPIIQFYIWRFIAFARNRQDLTFLVTEIGCGLAGYEPEDIAPLFREAVNLENVHLPQRFWDILNKKL